MTTVQPELEEQALLQCLSNTAVDLILKFSVLRVMHIWIRADTTNQ